MQKPDQTMSIHTRISKIEAALTNHAAGAVLLHEPSPNDDGEAQATFDCELAKAIEAGHQIVIHTYGKEPNRRIGGVIYESEAFAAWCALMAHTPATDGRSKDKLCQIINEVQGTTLPVFRGVRHGTL